MKGRMIAIALACFPILVFGEGVPKLVFSGYIDYPARHDYRIEIFTDPSGLISRVATYSGEPKAKTEELSVARGVNAVTGFDQFQENLKTFEMKRLADSIRIVIINKRISSQEKTETIKNIRIRPGNEILFEDGEFRFRQDLKGDFRVESKADTSDAIVIRGNQIFDNGWYRSDWKREGGRTFIQEYTTMEIPGDWITDGGGIFTGEYLYVDDLPTNVMNYYILDIYLERHIFLPWIFGLKTGSY